MRVCLPMQGTRVRALVWEDPTGRRAAWAHEPQLLSLRVWSLWSVTSEAAVVRGPRPDEVWPPLAATRESLRTETKTQHSHK